MSVRTVELIFRTFARRYTNRWVVNFDDVAARELWRNDLSRVGVTDQQVVEGLKLSVKLKWPPSPGEFIPFCLPAKPLNASHRIVGPALPRPKVSLEKHNQRMMNIREKLNK